MVDPEFRSTIEGLPVMASGPWAGWSYWPGEEPFETYAGPFFCKAAADGAVTCGFDAQPHHMNGGGVVHGGALMTFADYSLFQIAKGHLFPGYSVTVSFNAEFVEGARGGGPIYARGEVVREGGSLVFVRGLIEADGKTVLSFSGVIKKTRPRT